jgi:hypothetical protein
VDLRGGRPRRGADSLLRPLQRRGRGRRGGVAARVELR